MDEFLGRTFGEEQGEGLVLTEKGKACSGKPQLAGKNQNDWTNLTRTEHS